MVGEQVQVLRGLIDVKSSPLVRLFDYFVLGSYGEG
jgi:hypothetical protein